MVCDAEAGWRGRSSVRLGEGAGAGAGAGGRAGTAAAANVKRDLGFSPALSPASLPSSSFTCWLDSSASGQAVDRRTAHQVITPLIVQR